MKRILLSILAISVVSCSEKAEKNVNTANELNKLKSQIDSLQNVINELNDNPDVRFNNAKKFLTQGNLDKAKKEYQAIVSKYTGTESAVKAEVEIKKINQLIIDKKNEEDRKKALGYKVLKENLNPTINDITLKFNRVSTSKRWIFDDYGHEYFYRDAERGNIHIVADVTISSTSKNPQLPEISAYKIEDGILKQIGSFNYKFKKWKDYGSYLGNYADYKNDFAHSKTISFTCGLEVKEDDYIKGNTYVILNKKQCFKRAEDSFGRPAVKYESNDCSSKYKLTIEDFESEYILIKII